MSDGEYDQEGWGSGDENMVAAGDDRPAFEIEIENNYYEAESMWKTNPEQALTLFESVI
jgi:hypothetical protein